MVTTVISENIKIKNFASGRGPTTPLGKAALLPHPGFRPIFISLCSPPKTWPLWSCIAKETVWYNHIYFVRAWPVAIIINSMVKSAIRD